MRDNLQTINGRRFNWIGQILRRNCFQKHVIEGKTGGVIDMMGRQGRRRKQLLDHLKETQGYWKLKEEVLDRTLWWPGFWRGYWPVVRQAAELYLPSAAEVTPCCVTGLLMTNAGGSSETAVRLYQAIRRDKAVPCVRKLIARGNPVPVLVRFIVDRWALRQAFLRVLQFRLVSIIAPILRSHLHLNIRLSEGKADEAWEPASQAVLFQKSGALERKMRCTLT